MTLSSRDFQLLDALSRREITSQRQLSEHSGLSLGQVNYVLRNLLAKGLVKLGNFRKSRNKIGYAYLLTPKGLEEKSRLASRFLVEKLREYHLLRERIYERLVEVETLGHTRLAFVGPEMVADFIDSIIADRGLHLSLTTRSADCRELADADRHSFDVVLVLGGSKTPAEICKILELERDRLILLW